MLSSFLHQGCHPLLRAQGHPACRLHWPRACRFDIACRAPTSSRRWCQEVERFWPDTIGAAWENTGKGIEVQQMVHTLHFGQQIGSILGSDPWGQGHTSGYPYTTCQETFDFQRIVREQPDRSHPQILEDEGCGSVVPLVLTVSEE